VKYSQNCEISREYDKYELSQGGGGGRWDAARDSPVTQLEEDSKRRARVHR